MTEAVVRELMFSKSNYKLVEDKEIKVLIGEDDIVSYLKKTIPTLNNYITIFMPVIGEIKFDTFMVM